MSRLEIFQDLAIVGKTPSILMLGRKSYELLKIRADNIKKTLTFS
jgi:hypothetical protein